MKKISESDCKKVNAGGNAVACSGTDIAGRMLGGAIAGSVGGPISAGAGAAIAGVTCVK
ncbi:hypothetical protein [Staphylococcus arlettae]|uniref:hypothetical protein n=1 Tax=Staphylococcus arlettae TaxID=29378 RepID=UPI0021CF66B0|nr:hypothetical protein [Staphylococcus arlettae]UXU51195.1 hypothetical protein MUA37_13135 [Staphylococcus arlettae]